MAEAVSQQSHTVEAQVQSQAIPYGIYGGQNVPKTGFLHVFRCFSDTVIPPIFHTHSFICHQHHVVLAIDSVIK